MDPDIFPEPEIFKPSRFIQDGNLINTKYILQFGLGARKCIGSMMAMSEFFLFVSRILQNFTLHPPDDAPETSSDTFKPDPGQFGVHARPYKLRAIPR